MTRLTKINYSETEVVQVTLHIKESNKKDNTHISFILSFKRDLVNIEVETIVQMTYSYNYFGLAHQLYLCIQI